MRLKFMGPLCWACLMCGACALPRRPPGQGPLSAPPQGQPPGVEYACPELILALAAALALAACLAVARRVWRRKRAGRGGWAGGHTNRLKAALSLVEQVMDGCQRRLKVIDFDQWVNQRRRSQPKRR